MGVQLSIRIAAGDEFGAAQREWASRMAVAAQLRHIATSIEFGAGRLLEANGTYCMGASANAGGHDSRGDINVDGVSIGSWFLNIDRAEEVDRG